MYPSGELRILAARKALLEARIAARRWQCAQHSARLAQPIAWIDRAYTQWSRISPVVKALGVPLLFGLGRRMAKRRGGMVSGVLRYAPLVLQGWRMFAKSRARAEAGGTIRSEQFHSTTNGHE